MKFCVTPLSGLYRRIFKYLPVASTSWMLAVSSLRQVVPDFESDRFQSESSEQDSVSVSRDALYHKTSVICPIGGKNSRGRNRSEEHTSELQSPCNLVCR